MERNRIIETALASTLVLLSVGLLYPWKGFMPGPAFMMTEVLLVACFALFAGFIWREHPRDEREEKHRELAGRTAFLTGTAVLVAGVLAESLMHELDPWLVAALIAMVIAKLSARMYVDMRE